MCCSGFLGADGNDGDSFLSIFVVFLRSRSDLKQKKGKNQ